MIEVRIDVTVDKYGNSEDAAEAFLEGFLLTHPKTGPVVSQNTKHNTMTVCFSVEAHNVKAALELASKVFAEGATASNLKPSKILDVTAEVHPPIKRSKPGSEWSVEQPLSASFA